MSLLRTMKYTDVLSASRSDGVSEQRHEHRLGGGSSEE
jgi:hypothetical protein